MNTPNDWFSTLRNCFTAECYSANNYHAYYAVSAFSKKWVGGGVVDALSESDRQKAAITKFLSVCEVVDNKNKTLVDDIANDNFVGSVIDEARLFLSRTCGTRYDGSSYDITDSCISWHTSCGPGASIGATGNSWLEKFVDSPLTYYPHQVSLHRFYLNGLINTSLSQVELDREKKHSHHPVQCCKMSFAPKSAKEERLIATEASLPMAYQLSLHTILSNRLKSIGIDFATQQFKNRKLACEGSRTKLLSTIDLSSASDMVCLALVAILFKDCPALLWWLNYLRSEEIILPNGQIVKLPMISTMGNGYTFALETLVFLSLVVGVARVRGIELNWSRGSINCGVYGDDIIVPVELYDDVIHVLKTVGFAPNLDKCFTGSNPFRESCGGDYLNGTSVRGVYLTTLDNDGELYSAINRLSQWSASTGIQIPKTLNILSRRLKTKLIVPMCEEISSGIRVPTCGLPPDWRSIPISLTISKILKLSPSWSGNVVYEKLECQPARRFVFDLRKMTMESRFSHSEMGVLQALLKGTVRNGHFTARLKLPRQRKTLASVPSWDELADDLFPFRGRVGFLRALAKALAPIL